MSGNLAVALTYPAQRSGVKKRTGGRTMLR